MAFVAFQQARTLSIDAGRSPCSNNSNIRTMVRGEAWRGRDASVKAVLLKADEVNRITYRIAAILIPTTSPWSITDEMVQEKNRKSPKTSHAVNNFNEQRGEESIRLDLKTMIENSIAETKQKRQQAELEEHWRSTS